MTFLPDNFKVLLLRNGRLFELRHGVSKIFVSISMNDAGSTRSSGYYSELCLKQEEQVVDEPDFAILSQCNIDRLVFDENNQERSPFSLTFCCGENSKLDWFLRVILIHHLVFLLLVIFCASFLKLCGAQNRFASGILALSSACVGHFLPTPMQWFNA